MRSLTPVLVLLAVLFCACEVSARKNWVLLIAGSNGYYNYRHQADVCHAYQIFHKAGVPDEQIVVMMYDDIANNPSNPVKGNIINHPDGDNVYPGVLKDYTKDEVNAKVFLAVLQGDKEAVKALTGKEGKVIDSGPDDYIFVNFADHGGPGILCTPSGADIKASELNAAIKSMYSKKRFAKMVFYVEACYSGSIFSGILPDNIDVYATTAANADESSYACYYDKKRATYLGDVYSVKWMEDTDKADLKKETLYEQFEIVKKETNTSHVMQYGDLTINKMALDKFVGNDKITYPSVRHHYGKSTPYDAIRTEDVREDILLKKLASVPKFSNEWEDINQELMSYRQYLINTERLFYTIARNIYENIREDTLQRRVLQAYEEIQARECYESTVDVLTSHCPGLEAHNNYAALRQFQVLVNLCNHNLQQTVHDAVMVAAAANPVCNH